MLFSDDTMTDEELRAEAVNDRDLHDPGKQEDNGYERCARCHFTRHPCETFFYADAVIKLLDRNLPAGPCDCPVSSGEGAWAEAHDPSCASLRTPDAGATGVRLPASSPADTDTDTTDTATHDLERP